MSGPGVFDNHPCLALWSAVGFMAFMILQDGVTCNVGRNTCDRSNGGLERAIQQWDEPKPEPNPEPLRMPPPPKKRDKDYEF
jgi:hypothetical protein